MVGNHSKSIKAVSYTHLSSLTVPHGGDGVVHDVKVYTKDDNEDLPSGVSMVVRVYIIPCIITLYL